MKETRVSRWPGESDPSDPTIYSTSSITKTGKNIRSSGVCIAANSVRKIHLSRGVSERFHGTFLRQLSRWRNCHSGRNSSQQSGASSQYVNSCQPIWLLISWVICKKLWRIHDDNFTCWLDSTVALHRIRGTDGSAIFNLTLRSSGAMCIRKKIQITLAAEAARWKTTSFGGMSQNAYMKKWCRSKDFQGTFRLLLKWMTIAWSIFYQSSA